MTFDPKLQLYLVESPHHLGARPIRVPAEVVKLTGHEEASDVSKVGLAVLKSDSLLL